MNITFKNDVSCSDYESAALRTAKDMGTVEMNLIHAAMGLASDAGEFVDCIKKHTIYGKALDEENAIEELGDVLWFVVLAANSLNVTLAEVMQANIDKLAKRYPGAYTDEAAIARADKVSANEADDDFWVATDTKYIYKNTRTLKFAFTDEAEQLQCGYSSLSAAVEALEAYVAYKISTRE